MYRTLFECISTVFLPLYSVHRVVLYRCVSCMYVSLCMVMNRFLCLVPSFATVFNLYRYMRLYRLSSILDDTVSNTGVIHVSDVSRVIRRYLSGISAHLDVSCLRGVSTAGTYLPYTYPTRLLPLLLHTTPTTPTSYYPYYTPKWV